MAVTAIVATVASTAVQYVSGRKQQRMQERQLAEQKAANQKAAAQAEKQQEANEVAYNKANRKQADVSGMQAGIAARQGAGAGGTLLTGQEGVGVDELNLGGGSTLLGG